MEKGFGNEGFALHEIFADKKPMQNKIKDDAYRVSKWKHQYFGAREVAYFKQRLNEISKKWNALVKVEKNIRHKNNKKGANKIDC